MSGFDAHRLRAQEHALQDSIDTMLEDLERRQADLRAATAAVARMRVRGESPNGLVRVETDASGTVQAVDISPEAFRRSTPESLAASVTQAAQSAATSARAETARLMGTVVRPGEEMPDLPDLVPGAPSLRSVLPEPMLPTEPTPPPGATYDDDDSFTAPYSFLEDPRR